ncbi:uncharacterized protein KRP23_410 [Phytophthora ramorum]|uniref:uncharacterized protein n=1 Tax=Phytophthora ramorum TaxID=164328 RepID=UPI0030A6582E|nr:hypothetical protein KRP23_410 [Phytophthora ramorum]
MESVSTAAVVAHDQAVVTVPLVHVGRRREGTVRPAASVASPVGVDGSIVDMTDDVMVDAEVRVVNVVRVEDVAHVVEAARVVNVVRVGDAVNGLLSVQLEPQELVRVAVIMVTRLEQSL